jgi:hypothetical protein
MFFSNPESIFEEMGNHSVLITPHRYTPKYDTSATSGIYCVQFVTFKRDKYGLEVLDWWTERCLEWCYQRVEDGKFGDQKYLDEWPERFKGVFILNNIGAGVAPWNIQQYKISSMGDLVKANDKDIVFFHYHHFKCYTNGEYDLGPYNISVEGIELIYRPYIKAFALVREQVSKVEKDFNCGIIEKYNDWTYLFRYLNRRIRGFYHVVR